MLFYSELYFWIGDASCTLTYQRERNSGRTRVEFEFGVRCLLVEVRYNGEVTVSITALQEDVGL